MHKTNTILINNLSKQNIRLFINDEIFIDQILPFKKNKLTVNYNSDNKIDKFAVTDGDTMQYIDVSSDQTVTVDFNK